jgi:hypothetical protein
MNTFDDLLAQIRTATTMAGLNRAYRDAIEANCNQYRAERDSDRDGVGATFARQQQQADDAWNERAARGGFVA